jgi:SAM-dependent methyltransferase
MEITWLAPEASAPCPLCPGGPPGTSRVAASTALPGRARVDFFECSVCGSLFDPGYAPMELPAPQRMLEYYLEQGAGIDVMVAPLLRLPASSVTRYLEIGCGYGFCLDFACRELGWKGVGVDPSPLAVVGRRELGVPILHRLLDDDLKLPLSSFELAFASEVLEHVPEPLPFLRTIRRRLAPDGLLALTTPDAAAIVPQAPTDVLLRLLSPGHHAILYTAATLARVVGEAGFAAVRVEPADGTLRAFAGSEAALARLGPPRPAGDHVRRYVGSRQRSAPRGSALATGLAYRRFKADVQAGDHRAAEVSRRDLEKAVLARHGVDLDAVRALASLQPTLAGAAPFPFNLANALYFCGVHELNGRGDPGRAVEIFTVAVDLGERVLAEELRGGIGDGETADLLRESRRHVAVARARHEGGAALADLRELERGAGDAATADLHVTAAQLRRTRQQVFAELVHRGDYAAAAEIEAAAASDAATARAAGEDLDLAAPLELALGMARLVSDDPQAAAGRFGAAYVLGRGAAAGSAAAGVMWEARLHEAEALRRAGRGDLAAAIARELVTLAAVPVPPLVAARAAALTDDGAGGRPELAVGIDAYWRDAHGVYLRGWAHAHELPVRSLRLQAGARWVATGSLADRPDLLAHYPAHEHVRRAGFSLYLETGAGVPLSLVAETDGGFVGRELVLPDHPLPSWEPAPRQEGMPRLVRQFVDEVNALGPGALVLEIGVRGLSRTVIDASLAARRAAYRGVRALGVDVHPGPLVELVGDAHELSSFVRPGSAAGVLSGSVLEHLEAPWVVAAECNRVLRLGGLAYHAAPAAWPEHAMPNDFWRFTSEGLAALFGPSTGFEVLASESTGRAAILPDPSHRAENPELAIFPANTFSHVLARKVHELEPGTAVWPSDRAGRAARARLYPVEGVVGGR